MTAAELRLRSKLKQRGDYWVVGLSWYDSSGKRKQTNVSTGLTIIGNKYRAEAKEREIYREYERQLLSDTTEADKILFCDWLRWWLTYMEDKVEESTLYGYKKVIERNVIPYFEDKGTTLAGLTRKKIEDYYKFRQKVFHVSANTIKHEHANIHSALKWAVSEGVLLYNPSDDLRLPKMQKHIANTYTDDQLKIFLSAIKDTPMEPPILLAAWFGLRRGEIIGVKWDCIDFKAKTLSIRGTIKDQGKEGYNLYYEASAKTKSSIRSFPLTDVQVNYFTKLKEYQKHRQRVSGYCHDWDDFVCTYRDGKLIAPDTLSRAVPKLSEACGLPRLRLHELRHSNITLMVQNGVSILEASKWAGHSNPSTTANIYAHVDDKSKEKISKILAGLLS